MGYRSRTPPTPLRRAKYYLGRVVLILGLVLLLVIWVAVSMVDGCPVPHGGDNVRSGSSGHSRGYYHGGKY